MMDRLAFVNFSSPDHNGTDITKNKPVHVIMVLIGYVDIGDSSVNAHQILCNLGRAFIVLHTNIARQKSVIPCRQFSMFKGQ